MMKTERKKFNCVQKSRERSSFIVAWVIELRGSIWHVSVENAVKMATQKSVTCVNLWIKWKEENLKMIECLMRPSADGHLKLANNAVNESMFMLNIFLERILKWNLDYEIEFFILFRTPTKSNFSFQILGVSWCQTPLA